MSSSNPVVEVKNLSKCYEVYEAPVDRLKEFLIPPIRRLCQRLVGKNAKVTHFYREFWALQEVSFAVQPGETVGIIGKNGGGKSTLLQILAGTLSASAGEIKVKGRVAALLELGSGFNPDFTGRENVYLNGQILGLTRAQIDARFADIKDFADIGEFIDQPVKTYSSGMFVRLAFAVQAHIDASIVIIDEALAVGDIFFRQKCYQRLEALREQGAAILLVSHSMPDIEQYCDRAIVLNRGKIHFTGSASEAARHYYLLHQTEVHANEARTASPAPLSPGLPEKDLISGLSSPMVPRALPVDKAQIGNGKAHCVSISVCNTEGLECHVFRQGARAIFYYVFQLSAPIEVPIVGILIKNERGVIVHGKNSWQFGSPSPESCFAGDRLVCRHEVDLNLGPGEYVFEVGLSAVPFTIWAKRNSVSHEEMSAAETRVCHVSNAGMFSVGLWLDQHVAKLTHHGVTDLGGSLAIGLDEASRNTQTTETSEGPREASFYDQGVHMP